MNSKMNNKFKLAMQLVTVLYLLICAILSNHSLINSSNFINFPIIIWTIMWGIIWFNSKKLEGITDELSISILSRVNNIGVYFLMISVGLFSILLISPVNKNLVIAKATIGIYLMLILFIFTIIRLLVFIYYDRKGIHE